MKAAALLVGLVTIVVGVLGLVSPDGLTTARRLYFATSAGLYTTAAVRATMGLVLIAFARHSRTPKILLAMGIVMSMQALSATLLGPVHARAILEWEAMHTGFLRAGALVAVVVGGFLVFAVASGRRS